MTKKKNPNERRRLNLTLPVQTFVQIDDIQRRMGAESTTEVIRRAIALLDVVSRGDGVVKDEYGLTVKLVF